MVLILKFLSGGGPPVEVNSLYEKVLDVVQKEVKDGIVGAEEGDSMVLQSRKRKEEETERKTSDESEEPEEREAFERTQQSEEKENVPTEEKKDEETPVTLPTTHPTSPRKRFKVCSKATTGEDDDMKKLLECEEEKIELLRDIAQSLRSIASALNKSNVPASETFMSMLTTNNDALNDA